MVTSLVFCVLVQAVEVQCPRGPQYLSGSGNGPLDRAGAAVAIDGDVAVVGAPWAYAEPIIGAVHVFRRIDQDWQEEAVFRTPDNNDEFVEFGAALDVSGDLIVVGAKFADRAYLYRYSADTEEWTLEAIIQGSTTQAGDWFGASVAVCNNTIVVGAPRQNGLMPSEFGSGAVYVFRFDADSGQWAEEEVLHGMYDARNFGHSVDVNGDRIAAGAPASGWPYPLVPGFVEIFRGSNGRWTRECHVSPHESEAFGDLFGFAVAIEDDVCAIGAPAYPVYSPVEWMGAAYVYRYRESWGFEAELIPSGQDVRFMFGGSVVVDSGRIVVGRYFGPIEHPNHSWVAVFGNDAGEWVQLAEFSPPTEVDNLFGYHVALSDENVLIGMPRDMFISEHKNCGAWLYSLRPEFRDCNANGWDDACEPDCNKSGAPESCDIASGLSEDANHNSIADECEILPNVMLASQQLLAPFPEHAVLIGGVIAMCGDWLVAGRGWGSAVSFQVQNEVYVYHRTGGQWMFSEPLFPSVPIMSSTFGESVAIDEDVIVAGAPRDQLSSPYSDYGSVCVFRRTGNGWQFEARLVSPQPVVGEQFGSLVAVSGNRIAVTTSVWSARKVYIFKRASTAWGLETIFIPPPCTRYFGRSLVLNNNQLLVGTSIDSANCPGWATGAVSSFRFNGSNWVHDQTIVPIGVVMGGFTSSTFGISLALDNGQLAAGMPTEQGQYPGEGSVYLFRRSETGWMQVGKLRSSDPWRDDRFGSSVSLKSDLLVVGVLADDDHGIHSGSAYVFRRMSGDQWTAEGKLLPNDGARFERFGASVATNGTAMVVGAPYHTTRTQSLGALYAWPGFERRIGDITGDGHVDAADLFAVINGWGSCPKQPQDCPADIAPPPDGDEYVNVNDLILVINNWG